MIFLSAQLVQSARIGNPILGVIIPLVVFIVSFIVTWALYKHFSKHS